MNLVQEFQWKGIFTSIMTVEVVLAAGLETILSLNGDTKDGCVCGLEDDSCGSTARGKPAATCVVISTLSHIQL